MTVLCPVCGSPLGVDAEPQVEEQFYSGPYGAELKMWLPFCGSAPGCNRVTAANKIDRLAEDFRGATADA